MPVFNPSQTIQCRITYIGKRDHHEKTIPGPVCYLIEQRIYILCTKTHGLCRQQSKNRPTANKNEHSYGYSNIWCRMLLVCGSAISITGRGDLRSVGVLGRDREKPRLPGSMRRHYGSCRSSAD